MSKLALQCDCGQEMAVPDNALGKKGLCPACGTEIRITKENTTPWRKRRGGGLLALARSGPPAVQMAKDDDAARLFAEAVDLYNQRRYAEALTVLNTLQGAHPGNPHVETAQRQCALALQRSTGGGTRYAGAAISQDELSPELVKSVVLDKMLNAGTDEAQLQAADLAAQLLGMYGPLTSYSEADEEPPEVLLSETSRPRKSAAAKKSAKARATRQTRNGRDRTRDEEIS